MAFRSSFARAALLFINLFVLLGGIAVLGIGAWIVQDLSGLSDDKAAQLLVKLGIGAVILGIFVLTVGLSGFFGACKESVCCLKFYVGLLSLMMVLEMVIGVFSIVASDKIETEAENQLMQSVMVYNIHPEATSKIDYLQDYYKCCGATGPSDYEANKNVSATLYGVPASCCKSEEECTSIDSESIHQTGCVGRLLEFVDNYFGVLIGVFFAVVMCQIISVVFAYCLIRSVQDEQKV